MFLTTADGDTPLAIGLKEQEEEEEDEDEEDEEESCINYLKGMLGVGWKLYRCDACTHVLVLTPK